MEKMTKKAFYTKVVTANVSDELNTFATAELAKLDKVNETRKGKESAKSAEFGSGVAALVETLVEGVSYTAPALAADMGITTQKASALLRRAVDLGLMTSADVKVVGHAKIKAYTKPFPIDADEEDVDDSDDDNNDTHAEDE